MRPLYVRLSREDPSADVALQLRASLMKKAAGGHPLKSKVLNWLVRNPAHRIPQAVKAAALGQRMQNRIIGVVPQAIKKRLYNPLFSGKGPERGIGICMRRCIWNAGTSLCPAPGAVPRCRRIRRLKKRCCIFPVAGEACFPGLSVCQPWGCCCGRRRCYPARSAFVLRLPVAVFGGRRTVRLQHGAEQKGFAVDHRLRDQARLPGDAHCHGMWFVP